MIVIDYTLHLTDYTHVVTSLSRVHRAVLLMLLC